mmetsp:Transcript_279/g.717  ORF Transcript_279/g.717 Transcript_279/m.717 type:complete len:233 (-) Transcript_279:57-755(-)
MALTPRLPWRAIARRWPTRTCWAASSASVASSGGLWCRPTVARPAVALLTSGAVTETPGPWISARVPHPDDEDPPLSKDEYYKVCKIIARFIKVHVKRRYRGVVDLCMTEYMVPNCDIIFEVDVPKGSQFSEADDVGGFLYKTWFDRSITHRARKIIIKRFLLPPDRAEVSQKALSFNAEKARKAKFAHPPMKRRDTKFRAKRKLKRKMRKKAGGDPSAWPWFNYDEFKLPE